MRLLITGTDDQLMQVIGYQAALFGADVFALRNAEINISAQDLKLYLEKSKAQIVVNSYGNEITENHVINANNISLACSALDIPIIQMSSAIIYGTETLVPLHEASYVSPETTLGRALLRIEDNIAANNKNFVILRTSWQFDAIASSWLDIIPNIGDKDAELYHFNPTSGHDLANGIFELANNLLSSPKDADLRGVFNIANSGNVSLRSFANYLNAYSSNIVIGKNLPFQGINIVKEDNNKILHQNPMLIYPKNAMLDCNKILQIHGIDLGDWQIALGKVLESLKINNSNK